MIEQEKPSDEHIADLLYQFSCLDPCGLYEPINTVHHEVAGALHKFMEQEPERFTEIFRHVAEETLISPQKQTQLMDFIELWDAV